MGNCLNPRAVTWVDDEDWEPKELDNIKEQRRKHKKSKRGGKESKVEPSTTAVKIKLTKRQLEELLVRTDTKGLLPINEVIIYRLMKKASKESTCGGRSWGWRPTLKSIPEEVVEGVGS